MKRLLISIFISFAFFSIGFSVLFALEEFQVISEETSYYLATPIRLPVYIYEDILGFEVPVTESEDDISLQVIMAVVFVIIFNVIMYGIIFYFLSGFLLKLRGDPKENRIETPPEPPIFRDK